ncbi:hypothetical protein IVU49_21155 [Salmonella enterica subsp. enterica serovar Worthington]|nr:hypothetical protein [Salmonella enterica subsp. enterica serovar Worthington]
MGGSGFYFCCGLSPLAREHSHCSIWGLTTGGLSPLAREHPCSGVNITCGRFIRWRGNTPAVLAAHYSTPVYPAGAGTRFTDYIYSVECRFIPAGAGTRQFAFVALHTRRFIRWRGNTVFNSGRLISSTVYPRWRGNTQK